MFKIFPATITSDGQKVPLISNWQNLATTDHNQLKAWVDEFGKRIRIYGIPTGPVNDLFVLDVDVKKGGLESIKAFEIPPTLTQRTFSGGLHYFFRYPRDGRHYGNRVNLTKEFPGLDTRGVGGWAAYYGFIDPKQPIAEAPTSLLELAVKKDVPQSTGIPIKVDPTIARGIVESAFSAVRDAPQGESNNTLNVKAFELGQLVAGGSITREYAEAVLLEAANARGKPEREAKATIKSGLDGGSRHPLTCPFGSPTPQIEMTVPPPPGPPERWTPKLFSREDLFNVSALKRPQLFQDWSTEDIHITTADGGTGKTTLKLYESICLALGHSFLGFQCLKPGSKTLFITGEDTALKLGAMIGRILTQMGLAGNDEVIEVVRQSIVVKKDSDLCLVVKDRNGFLQPNQDAMRKVMEAIEDVKPKFVVFDPISSFWGSESALNDMNKAVTKFMSEIVERCNVCVEMINHMGKQSSANKDMSQFAGRGGTGLPSNSRVSRVLRPVFEEEYTDLTGESLEESQTCMMCVVNKFSDGSPLLNKPFLIIRQGYLFTRKTLTDAKVKEAKDTQDTVERVFQFIKDSRSQKQWPTEKFIEASLMRSGNPPKKVDISRAISILQISGFMGEKIRAVENPDLSLKEKVFVILDQDGKEV